MLEFPNIQSRGFRNIKEGNDITGFQVPVRLTYYRGVWLPQLRPATVTVDGETFEGDQITWVIDGTSYAQDDLPNYPDVQWSSLTPAILQVSKPGGLALGVHDVEVQILYSTSYLPPRMDIRPERGTYQRTMVLAATYGPWFHLSIPPIGTKTLHVSDSNPGSPCWLDIICRTDCRLQVVGSCRLRCNHSVDHYSMDSSKFGPDSVGRQRYGRSSNRHK